MTPEQIRELRARLGLTQAELASRLHVSQGTVADWERGKNQPGRRSERDLRHLAAKVK